MRSLAIASCGAVAGAVVALAAHRILLRRLARLRIRLLGDKAALLAQRRRSFCPAQSVSYANTDPLLLVEGHGARLVDEAGRSFLDTRNNVAHVGHAHPAIAAAVASQAALLNTNTRYLHPHVCELSRRLLETMPSPLCDGVTFFVNSGSEANDLALRLARAVHAARHGNGGAGGGRWIVVDHAYHGHTDAVIGLSPYKFEHRSFGGKGQPAWVTKCPAPDTYRGPHRGADAGAAYAKYVADACAGAGADGVCGFIVESGMSVAGVLVPPEGYLAACYRAVRAAGGVCVADEVQTGLGRFGGDVWWAFEQQRVCPDIVTLGKPFGNGMPLAAVVCTRAVSDAFAAGPEYFNTFGGNPVCAAAGLAVLDVIHRERLREHAATVGAALREALQALARSAEGALIGDVRGVGLFLGIEFVRDRATLQPATKETSYLCSRLKDVHRILTSIDGPHDNVIVVKPPMCFSADDARTLVDALTLELRAIGAADLSAAGHTPT